MLQSIKSAHLAALESELASLRQQRDALAQALRQLAMYVDAYEWGLKWAGRPHAQMDAARAALATIKD